MKNIFLILMIVLITACGKGGGASKAAAPAAVINPELYGRLWQTDYSVGPNLRSDQLSAMGEDALIETYQTGSLIGSRSWTITPVTATTMRVSDGVDTFIVSYEINGNVMDLCYDDGSCSTFMY